jgi:outer membrane receptor protein involved in Fe transport
LDVNLAAYRTDLFDDIYAVSPKTTSLFFQNVGTTRRQGFEAQLQGRWGRVDTSFSYAFTDARFETPLVLPTPRTGGLEIVEPGSQIPLVPQHRVRALVSVQLTPWASLSCSGSYVGSQYPLGDEANEVPPLPGYFLMGLSGGARWRWLTLSAQVMNLLNRQYVTFGTWSINAVRQVEQFVTPGLPLRAFVSVGADIQ